MCEAMMSNNKLEFNFAELLKKEEEEKGNYQVLCEVSIPPSRFCPLTQACPIGGKRSAFLSENILQQKVMSHFLLT